MQLYPSWRYAAPLPGENGHRSCLVQNEEEHAALGEGWYDSPAKFPVDVPASKAAAPEDVDDFANRYLEPAAVSIANKIDADCMKLAAVIPEPKKRGKRGKAKPEMNPKPKKSGKEIKFHPEPFVVTGSGKPDGQIGWKAGFAAELSSPEPEPKPEA